MKIQEKFHSKNRLTLPPGGRPAQGRHGGDRGGGSGRQPRGLQVGEGTYRLHQCAAVNHIKYIVYFYCRL